MITTDKGKAILEELLKGSKHTQLVNIVSSQEATMITTEQRQILTEWLGEKWNEPKIITKMDWGKAYPRQLVSVDTNRTFTTWEDFGAVVEKLTDERIDIIIHTFQKVYGRGKEIPERFCILVAEAKKEGVIK